jgi:putative modified peptide
MEAAKPHDPAKCLPADVAATLLQRMIDDAAFHQRFRFNPRSALAEIAPDLAANPNGPWACLHGQGMPSAETLREARETLLTQMTAGEFTVFKVGG